MYYVNENARDLLRIGYHMNRRDYLRLDLNENPGGLPQEFISKVLSEIDPCFISEYPEMEEFTAVLADFVGVKPENLCIVNGSSEGIRHIIEAFTAPGGKILGVTPSYAMFEVYSKMYGREFIPVSYTRELTMPIDNILEKMAPDIQLMILVNPNNPMGNAYTEEEFRTLLARAKELEITVLVDEAYHYFYPETFVKYAVNDDHVLITRTFSKLFSLAGLRLGCVIGSPASAKVLNNLCTPHNVNAVSMLFARKMMESPEIVRELIDKHREGRMFLRDWLVEHGYEYMGENGNFIFIKQKTDADRIVERMEKEKKILIKSYDGIGKFGRCLRVSTAEKRFMEQFVSALEELDK